MNEQRFTFQTVAERHHFRLQAIEAQAPRFISAEDGRLAMFQIKQIIGLALLSVAYS